MGHQVTHPQTHPILAADLSWELLRNISFQEGAFDGNLRLMAAVQHDEHTMLSSERFMLLAQRFSEPAARVVPQILRFYHDYLGCLLAPVLGLYALYGMSFDLRLDKVSLCYAGGWPVALALTPATPIACDERRLAERGIAWVDAQARLPSIKPAVFFAALSAHVDRCLAYLCGVFYVPYEDLFTHFQRQLSHYLQVLKSRLSTPYWHSLAEHCPALLTYH